ncbi:transposase, partial [Kibdelosporangium lantanae]
WDDAWRHGVRVVAIDMCTVFKAAVRAALPQARLVVEPFHLVQLANQALTNAHRRVTVQVRGRRGRKGNREWELRNRLTRSAARIHADHLDPMIDDLQPRSGISPPAHILPTMTAGRTRRYRLSRLSVGCRHDRDIHGRPANAPR